MPSIAQLSYLLAVARHGHFGRAASESGVSQPSLSTQIRKLEDELGVTVFDRNKHPVIATHAGEQVLELARTVVSEHRRLIHFCETRGQGLAGTFTLGVIPTAAPYVVPLFLDSFAKASPLVKLAIEEVETRELVRALLDDRIDAGIAATPIDEPRIRTDALYYEPFSVYLAAKHPLLKKKVIRDEMLDRGELWLLENGHCLRDQAARACSVGKGASAYSNVTFEAGSLDTLRQIVRSGRGYTLVPELFVQSLPLAERKAHVRPIAKPVPTREVSVLYRRDHLKAEIRDALAGTIRAALPKRVFTSQSAALRVLDATPLPER